MSTLPTALHIGDSVLYLTWNQPVVVVEVWNLPLVSDSRPMVTAQLETGQLVMARPWAFKKTR